jgi:hypothetical protein
MFSFSRFNVSRLIWRFGLVSVTATISAVLVLALLLAGSLIVSPTARAQAQQFLVRFVAVDSPEDFIAEQARDQLAALEANQGDVTPDEATAAGGMTSAERAAEVELPSPADATQVEAELQMGANKLSLDETMPVVQKGSAQAIPGLVSLEEAQNQSSFDIRTPSWLPEGYALKGVMVPPQIAAAELPQPADAPELPELPAAPAVAMLHYSNNAGDSFMLGQTKQSQIDLPGAPPQEEILMAVPQDKLSIEEVTVNGQSGQYLKFNDGGGQLHWQDAGGMMYDLVSLSLDRDTLIQIAASVQ